MRVTGYRHGDGRAATGRRRTTVAVYHIGQPLHRQLHRFSLHDRRHRRQPVPVRLQALRLRLGVHRPSDGRRRRLDVGGRRPVRLAQSSWVVVAPVRRQDAEVSVGPHRRLPLHRAVRCRRHAAAVRRHDDLLLAHLRLHSTRQASPSQIPVPGKTSVIRFF